MSRKQPYMKLFTADYLRSTREFTHEHHGVYALLLFHMWEADDGYLRGDLVHVSKIVRVDVRILRRLWPVISPHLIFDPGRGWTQKRLQEEREIVENSRRIRAEVSDTMWRKKREKAKKNNGTADAKADANASIYHSHIDTTYQDKAKPYPDPSYQPPARSLRSRRVPQNVPEEFQLTEPEADKPKRLGTRLPDGFKPDLVEAVRLGLSEAGAKEQADIFRDYWNAKTGQDAVKADWPATWRNWCRRAAKDTGRAPTASKPESVMDRIIRQARADEDREASKNGKH